MGASAGDVPFAIPKPSRNEVHCTFCRKDFPSAKALRRHTRLHAGKSIYKCSRCGRHLASRATMEMHQRSCGVEDCPHNCVTCEKGYHSKQALLQHLKVHQPPASVEDRTCPDCKQVFNLVKTMREHRATHRGPFPCPVEDCPAVFSLPKRRNRHPQGETWLRFKEVLVLSRPSSEPGRLYCFDWSLALYSYGCYWSLASTVDHPVVFLVVNA